MEGRFLSMILVPNRDAVAEARKAAEAQAREEARADAVAAKLASEGC